MRKYNGSIVIKFDTDATGNAGSDKPVTVYVTGTITKANLFEDDGITPKSNPVIADSDGNYSFTVTDGTYDLVIDEGLPTESKITKVQIFDTSGGSVPISGLVSFPTITLAIQSTELSSGDVIYVEDMEIVASTGKNFAGKGGVFFDVVLTSSVTPNGIDIRQLTGDPLLSLVVKNTDDIQMGNLGITTDAVERARVMLDSGEPTVTGGRINLPTGSYTCDNTISIDPIDASGLVNFTNTYLIGTGKVGTVLDFSSSPALSDGLSFGGGRFYGAKDIQVLNAKDVGIKQGVTPFIWNHVKFENVWIDNSGGTGLEAGQGFMGNYNQVFSTSNGAYGFDFLGLQTSVHLDNCYAVSNAITGYKFRTMSYSCINACASDSNGQHGYDYRNCYATSTQGSGSESNGRSGFYLRASIADGNNRNLKLDSLLGFQNNKDNAGWANLLHMQCTDPSRQNTALLTNSWGRQPFNPIEDIIVDGEGSYLVAGYNILEGGSKAQNKGYIQHLPRHALVRELSVTTSTDVVGLKSPQGFTTTYGGEILIMASNGDFSSASARNCAVYKLTVCKASSGTYLDLVQATGDVTGTLGSSEPSFTWTIVNDTLRATPIGLTTGVFNFEILATGFVKTTDPLND